MNSKKRYIPIVALGALLLSLLAILPLAGAGEVTFIDPDDINDENNGRLTDPRPEDQESTRQGGQVGILYEDDDLNRPIRRGLVFNWDGSRADVGGVTVKAHSNMLEDVQLGDYDGRTGVQLLKAGDYVYVGDPDPGVGVDDLTTVRKVNAVVRTAATRTAATDLAARWNITLDAAFPKGSNGNEVWRIDDDVTGLDEFSENYRFISTAAIHEMMGLTGTALSVVRLTAPVAPSGIGSADSTLTQAEARDGDGAKLRLGGETDNRLSTDDVIVAVRGGGATVEEIDRVDADRITFTEDLAAAGSILIAYWAEERNSTGSAISVQSLASTDAELFTLQETAENSDAFSGKIDLIPDTLSVPWTALADPYEQWDHDGDVSTDPQWRRTIAVGATVTLTGTNGGYSQLMVQYPRGWSTSATAAADENERPPGTETVKTVPDFSRSVPRLPVKKSDTITVNYPDGSATLDVETTKPLFSGFNPEHNAVGDDSRPTVSARVTDSGSGLAEKAVGIVFAIKTNVQPSAQLVPVKLAPSNADADEIPNGFEVEARLNSTEDLDRDGEIWWWAKATDKAGNVAYSDSQTTDDNGVADPCEATTEAELLRDANKDDRDDVKCDPHVIRVDNTKPTMEHAETGRWWDPSLNTDDSEDKTEYRPGKAKRNSILVIFDEKLEIGSVQARDFEVNDSTPVSADVYNVTVRDDSAAGDGNTAYYDEDAVPSFVGQERGYVFLTLSQDMTPNAEPKVEMVDRVSDLAGNDQSTQQSDASATDRIAPKLTVSIDEGARPVTKKSVTVRISSDENIDPPEVTFRRVLRSAPVDDPETSVNEARGHLAYTTLFTAQDADETEVSPREYTSTITPSIEGLYSVYVTATDTAGTNKGSSGHDRRADIDLDDDTKTILFELDKSVPDPDFDPADGDGSDGDPKTFVTDDANGYLRIDYSREDWEYVRGLVYSAGPFNDGPPYNGVDVDTHGRITIVSATLDGVDITGDLSSNDDNIFQYHLDGMAEGEYDLEVTVRDEAGNTNAAPHEGTVEIIKRKPYKLALNPGWNLVSLPGMPADTDINDVIPADHPITNVLGYDPTVPGAWLRADEGGDGTFSGTLETIEAGTAYWIKTDSFQTLDVSIPKPTPGSTALLPTIQISQGWNLVPILDVDGDFTLADQTANDNYFSGLTAGTIARIYTYDTVTNSWASVDETGDDDDDVKLGVKLGRGYWVYATKPGIIVP